MEAFRLILSSVPNLRIVFSSTWRWPIHVNRLHEQWLAHGLPFEITNNGTPDTREAPSVERIDQEDREIERWLRGQPAVSNWVAIDDDQMGIETVIDPAYCAFTDAQQVWK